MLKRSSWNLSALGLSSAIALITALSAHAGTVSSTFNVTAAVSTACTVAGTGLAFGAYEPTNASPVDGSSTVSVLCTLSSPYNIRLNQGLHGSAVSDRKMSDGASATLGYQLFRDASRTQNWGESDAVDTVDSVGTGANQDFTVYGRIPAGQNVPQGSYADTITVTVNF